ncbi:MAG: winged helix-turn-helix domain-containing protein [Thermoplasmatales archaeon]|jgi:transposase|nr:winged helix-turn-helix domain-containing protein [Thermoplasmatales archaeon]
MVDAEIEELKNRYKKEEDAEIRERMLMIIWLKSGDSSYEVAKRLFCPQSKVMYWKKRYEETGIEGLNTVSRSGRPPLISENAGEEIRIELSGRDHWKTSEISKIVEEKSGIRYTRRHIRRMVQEWGYSLITPRKKHKNSASPEEVEEFKKKQEKYWALSREE